MVTHDVAQYFISQGFDVVCAAFEINEPVKGLFLSLGVELIELISAPEKIYGRNFDLVWAHHWPVIGYCISELCVRYKYFAYSSLSAYEPLELISFIAPIADVVVCNSKSTRDAHLADVVSVDEKKLQVLNNSLGNYWFFSSEITRSVCVNKLGIISNHIPDEIREAIPFLEAKGVSITMIGVESKQALVDLDLVRSFDAVVTIGHSVQKCLAAGVPVYCYDRFGGPGWILEKNIIDAEAHNFSGRCCHRKISAESLAAELMTGYGAALDGAQHNYEYARKYFSLEKNISSVMRSLVKRTDLVAPLTANNTLRKMTQIYIRQKYGIAIPSVVNISFYGAFEPQKVELVLVKTSGDELAYFGISPLPKILYASAGSLSVAGVALGNDNKNPVVELVLSSGDVVVARAKPELPSPGIGRSFTNHLYSQFSGFSFGGFGSLAKGTYKIIVCLACGRKIFAGSINISDMSGA